MIRTDHLSLKYLKELKIVNTLQQKWLYKLLGYSFTIEYKPGRANVIADALSRQFQCDTSTNDTQSDNMCALITHVQPMCIQEIVSSYDQDKEVKDPIAQALVDTAGDKYSYLGGILR